MEQWQPLRVYIVGQRENFCRVLATNLQCWGFETVLMPSMATLCNDARAGDVVLYDLDDSFYPVRTANNAPASQHTLLNWDFQADSQFLLILSSRSVSRTMLEQLGAVALLQKPFEMGRLQRYLHILQRLVSSVGIACQASLSEPMTSPQPYEQAQPAGAASACSSSRGHEKLRVLVVDDDVDVAQAICQCLAYEPGYEVAVAYDGLGALERCLDWLPHCIVTDLIMPWMNGYQVMRCLSVSSWPAMPAFVVMSALTQLELPMDRLYLKGKAVAYVDKPFHIEHLLTAIRCVCAR